MRPIFLSFLVAPTMVVGGGQLHSRAVQSLAICTQHFSWMDNSKNISPCQVAASLDALCNNRHWIIPALNASLKYDPPSTNAGTATICTCSWASYNLLSACVACQGFPEQISQWSVYSFGCEGMLSYSTAFPTNLTLPDDVTIPYWAGKDPTQWPALTFNVAVAQEIAAEGHADITNTSRAPKESKNIGAIVGSAIGGLLVICVAIVVALCILRRRRQLTQSGALIVEKGNHMRSISDITTGSNANSVGYASLTLTSPPMVATNPPSVPSTVLTHTSSIRTIPFMSSITRSVMPYGITSSPPGQRTSPPLLPSHPEGVIRPFTLPPTNGPDKKQANGLSATPNALRMDNYRPVARTRRARFNPPTYEESSRSFSGRSRHRENQHSADTDHSLTSSRVSLRANGTGMANILSVVRLSPPSAVHRGHRPQPSAPRNERRQRPRTPTEASISGPDIA